MLLLQFVKATQFALWEHCKNKELNFRRRNLFLRRIFFANKELNRKAIYLRTHKMVHFPETILYKSLQRNGLLLLCEFLQIACQFKIFMRLDFHIQEIRIFMTTYQ